MTSWFWLVGAVALSLMPPLVKVVLGASEEVVTVFLAIFSVSIAIGSLLAAWLVARPHRAVSDPGRRGAARACSRSISASPPTARRRPRPPAIAQVFSPAKGIRIAIDLAGLAIAGGLFIVPSFAAVQSWAGADKRARVVAAVNVLNAAFIVGGTLVVAALQSLGFSLASLFLIIGVANLVALIWIARTMPANGLRDFLTTMLRAFYRMEVKGAENFDKRGAEPDRRAQPCELPRRGGGALADGQGAGVRDRLPDRAALVGEAVPQAHARDGARSVQAARDAHLDQRGEERRAAGDLPRGAHHRHRQPDEGL